MDIWAIGVLSHFLLLGTSPFEPSKGVTNPADNLAFRNARYVFMPAEVWRHISNDAKSFIALCLEREPESRPTAKMLLSMPWMRMARSMLEGTALTMPMTMPEKEEDSGFASLQGKDLAGESADCKDAVVDALDAHGAVYVGGDSFDDAHDDARKGGG
eukprot:g22690.t1